MYQDNIKQINEILIINKDFVKDLLSDGYKFIQLPNQIFFTKVYDWELCTDPPGNPRNFILPQEEIDLYSGGNKIINYEEDQTN